MKRRCPFFIVSKSAVLQTDIGGIMEQNKITIDGERFFKEVTTVEPNESGNSKIDEVERLIKEQYPWQLNDAQNFYSGIISVIPEDSEEQRKQTERQSFLAWLSDRPQRIYGGESWRNFESILASYSEMSNIWKLLRVFYNDGEYARMTEELMKREDRATEIPLLMVVDHQEYPEALHSEIRRVWFCKLNKEKSVIVVVIDRSKLMAMEQE